MLFKSERIIVIGLLVAVLTGCANYANIKPEAGIALPETKKAEEVVDLHSEESSDVKTGKNVVTLFIYYDRDEEYILEDEQAQIISNLFYNHEMELCDTPIANVETLAFQIGEDTLSTSMGDLRTLDGTINGEAVIVELSDDEYEAVYQIVSQYAQGVP